MDLTKSLGPVTVCSIKDDSVGAEETTKLYFSLFRTPLFSFSQKEWHVDAYFYFNVILF